MIPTLVPSQNILIFVVDSELFSAFTWQVESWFLPLYFFAIFNVRLHNNVINGFRLRSFGSRGLRTVEQEGK